MLHKSLGARWREISQRVAYLVSAFWKRIMFYPRSCPNCGSRATRIAQRKRWIFELRECDDCRIRFRYPPDTQRENRQIYKGDYSGKLEYFAPTDESLQELIDRGFVRTNLDFSVAVEFINELCCGGQARVIDFGCSWGYGTQQIQQAGTVEPLVSEIYPDGNCWQ